MFKMFRNKRNNLDEMKELELLKIESKGCLIAYGGILLAIIIQQLLFPGEFKSLIGESIILIILSIYLLSGCLKAGIWDRHLKPNLKTNVLISLLASIISGLILAINIYRVYYIVEDALLVFLITVIFTFAICLIALTVCGKLCNKRKDELEAREEEE